MAKRIQRSAKSTQPARGTTARSTAGAGGASPPSARGGRVKSSLITDFTVQLATLSEAGIPIVKALTILEGQLRPGRFKGILAEVTEDVASGTPLSESLAKHPMCFDPLYSSMVRAGEAGGVLDQILTRLASFREKADEIRGKVIGAMIYPLILSLVAGGVITAVVLFVIPRFEELFRSFNVELPQITQVLLDASTFAANYWYVVVGLPILLLVTHFYLLKQNDAYRYKAHGLLLKTPGVGGLVSRSMIADFSRTFGTLIQAGVPHLDALAIVRDATT